MQSSHMKTYKKERLLLSLPDTKLCTLPNLLFLDPMLPDLTLFPYLCYFLMYGMRHK